MVTRTRFGVLLALAVSVVLVLAALPADAGKPDKPGKPPPSGQGPGPGTTCVLAAPAGYHTAVETGDFSITLGRGTPGGISSACIDVWPEVEGPWWVTWSVNEGETIRELSLVPRDSFSPGDSCGGLGFKGNNLPSGPTRLPPDPSLYPGSPYGDTIPLPYVNACGTEFAELVDGEAYDYADTGVESPLVFDVGVSASKNAEVTVCIDLPPRGDFCD